MNKRSSYGLDQAFTIRILIILIGVNAFWLVLSRQSGSLVAIIFYSIILYLCWRISDFRAVVIAGLLGFGVHLYKETVTYKAIGYVENDFDQPTSPEVIQSAESRIILDPALREGLRGLESGQRIMVIFYFHRSQGYDLCQHPRGDRSRPQRGVFALRSPSRPNPIGVTVVDLVTVEGSVLRVRGLDAINGTPVLDLKPA